MGTKGGVRGTLLLSSGTEERLAESNSLAWVQDLSVGAKKFNALSSFVGKTCSVETIETEEWVRF